MKQWNNKQEKRQVQEGLTKFWNDLKPSLAVHGTTIVIAATGLALGYAAWYYTMTWAAWACLLCIVVSYWLGASLSDTMVNSFLSWREARRKAKALKEADDVPMTIAPTKNPMASPAPV